MKVNINGIFTKKWAVLIMDNNTKIFVERARTNVYWKFQAIGGGAVFVASRYVDKHNRDYIVKPPFDHKRGEEIIDHDLLNAIQSTDESCGINRDFSQMISQEAAHDIMAVCTEIESYEETYDEYKSN